MLGSRASAGSSAVRAVDACEVDGGVVALLATDVEVVVRETRRILRGRASEPGSYCPVLPSPATHAFCTVLKAGESVYRRCIRHFVTQYSEYKTLLDTI